MTDALLQGHHTLCPVRAAQRKLPPSFLQVQQISSQNIPDVHIPQTVKVQGSSPHQAWREAIA